MKLEDQCCSVEQAKELKALGIKQESLFYFYSGALPTENDVLIRKIRLAPSKKQFENYKIFFRGNKLCNLTKSKVVNVSKDMNMISAFTVAELSVMLGDYYPSWSFKFKGKSQHRWIATIITEDQHKDGKTITTEQSFDRYEKTQARALASLLISTIKVGYLKRTSINKRLTGK